MDATDGFVEEMSASPLGATLLAVIEARTRGDSWFKPSLETTPVSVEAAVEAVTAMSFGSLVNLTVLTGTHHVGPWMPGAPDIAAAAYRNAEARLPIAEAINDCFGDKLHAPIERAAQQWWSDGHPSIETLIPLFRRLDYVYGAGEFTWAGLRTATDPPNEVIEEMVGAWEIETGPVTRWWMPVAPKARVFEIHRAEDWARLVATHPAKAKPHPGWELPGINQHLSEIAPLLDVPGQRAARSSVRDHLVPDWQSVATEYDGIHLSWAGLITAEGCIVDLEGGGVAMLRYWLSELTLWLADVFDDPTIAPDPQINFASPGKTPDPPRIAVDRDLVLRLLGRSS